MIANLDVENYKQLEQIILQYLQIRNFNKAIFYLSTARKLSKSKKDKWLVERVKLLEEKIKTTANTVQPTSGPPNAQG